jgi:hypothetical protein
MFFNDFRDCFTFNDETSSVVLQPGAEQSDKRKNMFLMRE